MILKESINKNVEYKINAVNEYCKRWTFIVSELKSHTSLVLSKPKKSKGVFLTLKSPNYFL